MNDAPASPGGTDPSPGDDSSPDARPGRSARRRPRRRRPPRTIDETSTGDAGAPPVGPIDDRLDLTVDPSLPIAAAAEEIAAALAEHQVVIVAGETGSGKTTQLPKICLAAGRSRIGHTQPRRIAARSLAARVAEETGSELGDLVGYQVRFTKEAGRQTRLKIMTDGILLAEISHDRHLRRYDTIIIDEAHERSLTIDFLLGYLKQLLPKRPDLKVIVTSATIDTARFSAHFDDAPVIEVSGRGYPVEIRYRPVAGEGMTGEGGDTVDAIAEAVDELIDEPFGDILVFLSGEREIRDTAAALEARDWPRTEILPLYARLGLAEQNRVFQPHQHRRIVLATNVAETSLTVPGIRYVVDPGTARISRYSRRTKVQRLPIEPVSQASADQRAGRCGRIGPGVCVRLYSQEDYESRPRFTPPEILRTNLASVILTMADARLGDIRDFPFVEAPDSSQIADGLKTLVELGAIVDGRSERPRLTPIGRTLAQMPVDPRLGRMLIEAERQDCLREMEIIVAGLAIPDVREHPHEAQAQAEAAHRRFWAADERWPETSSSDLVALMRLWIYLKDRRHELSSSAFRRMCRQEYLNYLRIREWQDLRSQLKQVCRDAGLRRNSHPADAWHLHTAVLSGIVTHVGLADPPPATPVRRGRRPQREYSGTRGARFAISPGSAARNAAPDLVMAFELVETTRLWARTVAAIEPDQVIDVADHLVKRSYGEPRWVAETATVVATESVTLLGVPIVSGRTVAFAPVDPTGSRAIFIQSALVEERWGEKLAFREHNRAVIAEIREQLQRSRRGADVDDLAVFAFYDARIPAECVSGATFLRWWKKESRRHPDLLDLTAEDVADDPWADPDAFPSHWRIGERAFPLHYSFDPGAETDGVSVDIDVAQLSSLTGDPFTWQVPGLRGELVTELIRSLPKQVRTRLVPAPDHAAAALAWLRSRPDVAAAPTGDTAPSEPALTVALDRAIKELWDVDTAGLWQPETIPAHLRMTFTVVESDHVVAREQRWEDLVAEAEPAAETRLAVVHDAVVATGQTSWTFGDLAPQLSRDGASLGYPAVVDEGASVGVTVVVDEAKARRLHRRGIIRLVVLATPDPTRWVVSHLSNSAKVALGSGPDPSVPDLLRQARDQAVAQALAGARWWEVRSEAALSTLVERARPLIPDLTARITDIAARAIESAATARRRLPEMSEPTRSDIADQLVELVRPGFIAATPPPWLLSLPRYLEAINLRIDAVTTDPRKGAAETETILALEERFEALARSAGEDPTLWPAALVEVRWLLEELRVSLFAQRLGTTVKVSPKRVTAALDRITVG